VYVSWSSSSTYGGDSGNRIFVLYWRCSLIRVSVIRGSTVVIWGISGLSVEIVTSHEGVNSTELLTCVEHDIMYFILVVCRLFDSQHTNCVFCFNRCSHF
jgi:hypothetical protein